jgi:cytosine/adenosine deaminase-related metal-dependent hydrolase
MTPPAFASIWRRRVDDLTRGAKSGSAVIRGARCAQSAEKSAWCSIQIESGRVSHIGSNASPASLSRGGCVDLDLTGYLILPGLVNAHDHLQFALYPRLGDPPYGNYVAWGEDIHHRFADVIAMHHEVPKNVRLWWGGIRNLLCGVTTVCHHGSLREELRRDDFPVRVVQQYGWGHSLALGGDLLKAREATPSEAPFIMHACEGVDALGAEELDQLDRLGVLDAKTVLVHALALDEAGVDLLRRRRVSLIVCPSSNDFLFKQLPSMEIVRGVENLALGNDSPLTAEGDLLDEVRFAIRRCDIHPDRAYAMVTEAPAVALRLREREGTIEEAGVGDLIAVRDTGRRPADTLESLSMHNVELVMIGGYVQLASEAVWKHLPSAAQDGLEPLWIDGIVRWLRAPVDDLLRQAETVLGVGQVRLGGRAIRTVDSRPRGA